MGLRVLEELIKSGRSVPVYESLSQIHESENGGVIYTGVLSLGVFLNETLAACHR